MNALKTKPETQRVIERRIRSKPELDGDGKLQRLMEELRSFQGTKFTGYIRINYTQGSIARVEKFEEILRK